MPETKEKDIEDKSEDECIAVGVMREGQALRLGISLEDMKKMTRSELQQVIMRAYDLN